MNEVYGLHNNQTYILTPSEENRWTSGTAPSVNPIQDSIINTSLFATGIVGIRQIGNYQFSPSKRGWDYIVPAIRNIEEWSPGKVFRTFQVSNMMSPLESVSRDFRYIGEEQIRGKVAKDSSGRILRDSLGNQIRKGGLAQSESGRLWLNYIEELTGEAIDEKEGFRFEGGKLYRGKTSKDVLLKYASVVRSPIEDSSPKFQQAYARSLSDIEGETFTGKVFRQNIPHLNKAGVESKESFMFIGGKTKAQYAKRFISGYGTSLIERLNQLARSPTELPFIKDLPIVGKINLGVKPASGLMTAGKLALKLGVVLPAAYLGYKELDYRIRETEALDETLFSEGITAAGATLWTRSQVAISKFADIFGLHDYREAQEEIAPGSTNLLKVAAFPILGMFAGYTAGYFGIGKRGGAGWKIGAAIGTALIAPFIPGALIPSERPEELEAIYSGKKEVAIRKGRYWELGRCLIKSNTYELFDGSIKTSEEIKIGDQLIGRDNESVKVINIFKRHHSGEIIKFYTAFDRDIFTGVTRNHIIPVLRDDEVIEINAEDIKINDLVEIPYRKIQHNINELSLLKIIDKYPVFIEEKKIYSSQINWFTNKQQKSGKCYLPLKIELDEDLGYLFGIFLAEGNISFTPGNMPAFIETVHSIKEEKIRDLVLKIAKEKFNIQGSYRFKKDGKIAKEGCWIVRLCSSILSKLFCCLFYEKEYNAKDKFIPNILTYSNKNFKIGLIQGYFDGDGHLDHETKIITSSRKWLLTTIQNWAINLEITSGISVHSEEGISNQGLNCLKSWRIRFFKNPRNNTGCILKDGKLFSRIRKIEIEDYNDIVYDFEVDHPDHLLKAGTFLVHNSPYEGGQIDRYQQHWYPRMLARAKEKAIWGEDVPSPIEQWYKENFTYELEEKFAESRPYPITSPAFSSVPLIGPLLSATIGKLIKPIRYMHEEDWRRRGGEGEIETVRPPLRHGQQVTPDELGAGNPISPYGAKGVIGEQIYRTTEAIGFPGFIATSVKNALTGSPDVFDEEEQLAAAGEIYSPGREFWDKELGGLGFSSELFRRLYPHRRNQIPLYNPIPNAFANVDWLPGEGEKSINFKIGDPFAQIRSGEERLPGEGYAARFPELKGVDPSDYPLIHRYKILADVAKYTDKFDEVKKQAREAANSGQFNEEEMKIYKETREQLKARSVRREFTPYKWKERANTPIEEILAQANKAEAEQTGENSWFSRTVGRYWETLTHNAETPLEFLTPVSPAHKLIHTRTAVEDYERLQLYGTEMSFWDRPIEGFIKPFITSASRMLGWEGIPDDIEERRSIEDYFDVLKYVKYTKLKEETEDIEKKEEYENKRRETLFGIDPYTFNFTHIFRSMPRRERNYYNEFVKADVEEREQILEMIPENEKALYETRWKMRDLANMVKAEKKGLLTEAQSEEVKQIKKEFYDKRKTEGFPKNEELLKEYEETKKPGESYADWYRRVKLLPKKLAGRTLPGPDWVGFSSQVNLEDIKLKVIQEEGKSMFDFDLWPDRARTLVRRPQAQQAAEELMEIQDTPASIKSKIDQILANNNIRASLVSVSPKSEYDENSINVEISEDRTSQPREIIRRYQNG